MAFDILFAVTCEESSLQNVKSTNNADYPPVKTHIRSQSEKALHVNWFTKAGHEYLMAEIYQDQEVILELYVGLVLVVREKNTRQIVWINDYDEHMTYCWYRASAQKDDKFLVI